LYASSVSFGKKTTLALNAVTFGGSCLPRWRHPSGSICVFTSLYISVSNSSWQTSPSPILLSSLCAMPGLPPTGPYAHGRRMKAMCGTTSYLCAIPPTLRETTVGQPLLPLACGQGTVALGSIILSIMTWRRILLSSVKSRRTSTITLRHYYARVQRPRLYERTGGQEETAGMWRCHAPGAAAGTTAAAFHYYLTVMPLPGLLCRHPLSGASQ